MVSPPSASMCVTHPDAGGGGALSGEAGTSWGTRELLWGTVPHMFPTDLLFLSFQRVSLQNGEGGMNALTRLQNAVISA